MSTSERLAVAGTGAIACGLAAVAAQRGEVVLLGRSRASAKRAERRVRLLCKKAGGSVDGNLRVTCDRAELGPVTFLVEAIVEDADAKASLLEALGRDLDAHAILASTTSSLSVRRLAAGSGRPDRFVALHVFNPVPKMSLVELAFPPAATGATRLRAHALCEALGKSPVEVPDIPGFVVNRLLFPYLFEAVKLMDATRLEPRSVDTCMQLGAAHPLGPLALLDLVGLDVAAAIGRTIGAPVPERIEQMIAEGALGRKTKRGFYAYDD